MLGCLAARAGCCPIALAWEATLVLLRRSHGHPSSACPLSPPCPAMDETNVIQLFARYCDKCDCPITRGQTYVSVHTPLGLRSVHKGCMGGVEREPDPTPGGSPVALAA
jgi:hypothetical protein